jgi:hypothetical protein
MMFGGQGLQKTPLGQFSVFIHFAAVSVFAVVNP